MFNAITWTDYGCIDLSQFANNILKQLWITKKSSAYAIFRIFQRDNPTLDKECLLHAAGDVCAYFYLKSTQAPTISDFLNSSYVLFNKEQKVTDSALLKKMEECKKVTSYQGFIVFADTIQNPELSLQTEVLIRAFNVLYVRFISDVNDKKEAKEPLIEKRYQEIDSENQNAEVGSKNLTRLAC